MKPVIPLAALFPLTVFAALAAEITYLSPVFNSFTHWVVLAALMLFLLARARFFAVFHQGIGPLLAAWIGWALLTTLWSQLPALSLVKGIVLAATLPALASGGLYWVRRGSPGNPLVYILPLTVLSLAVAVFGLGTFHGVRGIALFVGLADNPNVFGALIAMSLPYPLFAGWRAASQRGWKRSFAWAIVVVLLLLVLLLTRSRGAAVIAACTMVAFALATLPRRIWVTVGLCAAVLVIGVMTIPAAEHRIAEPARVFLYKGMDSGLLETRRRVWAISYEYARLGGLVGLGLGVSGDSPAHFDTTPFAIGDRREKGSSPLAIVEETGLVGLVLSLLLVGGLCVRLGGGLRGASPALRVPLALLAGVLCGMLVQSLFEAWWLAPGSGETMYFWATAGVATGMAGRSRDRWRDRGDPGAGLVAFPTIPDVPGTQFRDRSADWEKTMQREIGDEARDQINLKWLWSTVLGHWKLLLACALVGALVYTARSYGAPPVYRIEMHVAAANPAELGADLVAGERLHRAPAQGNQRNSNTAGFALYLESLATRETADAVLRDTMVMRGLFPGSRPDESRMRRFLADEIFVDQDSSKHAFATVRMRSTRPDAAAHLLLRLQQAADSSVRTRALNGARERLVALDAVPQIPASAGSVREAQGAQQVIVARALAAAPFAAQLIDQPLVRLDPSSSMARGLASAVVMGVAIGALLACLLGWVAERRKRHPEAASS